MSGTATLAEPAALEVLPKEYVIPEAIRAAVEGRPSADVIEERKGSDEWDEINRFERLAAEFPQIHCPLQHHFTPVHGYPELWLYTRAIEMPAGALITSRIHLHEHPFEILKGAVSVWSNRKGWETFVAPYIGMTEPGTRRVLYIHADTVWSTSHVTKHKDPDSVVREVTYDHMRLGHMNDVAPEKLAAVQANAQAGSLIK